MRIGPHRKRPQRTMTASRRHNVDKFNIGEKIAIFGKVEFYQTLRFIHPEFDILDDDDPVNTGCIIPLYSSNTKLKNVGLESRGLRKLITNSLNEVSNQIYDHFSNDIINEEKLYADIINAENII